MAAEITTENNKEKLNDDVIGTTVSTVTNDLSDSLDEESLDDYPGADYDRKSFRSYNI